MEEPQNREETGRNPDGTFKKGFTGNPGGRPRNPLKEFSLAEFESWTDDEKRKFLKKINPIDRWRMTEGNPHQTSDFKHDLGDETRESIAELTEFFRSIGRHE